MLDKTLRPRQQGAGVRPDRTTVKSNHNNMAFDGCNSSALHSIRGRCAIECDIQVSAICFLLRCEGTEEPRVCIGRGFIAEATRQTAGDSSIIESTHEG